MDASTAGRVALVTAAAGGLGAGIATALAAAGYGTAFTYRPGGTPPDATLARIRAAGHDGLPVAADFAQRGGGTAAVEAVVAHFGRLDVLVHNAGPLVTGAFSRSTRDDYDRALQTNFGSAVECAAAALPGMRERGFGRIVFFGMNGSHATQPAKGLALYAAAKAAVVTFARTLALEEAKHGVTVNVVEPGDIRDKVADRAAARAISATNPTGRAGSWEDVAAAVLFLVSGDASFVNGATLQVNGGLVGARE